MHYLEGKTQAPRWAPRRLLPLRSVTDMPQLKYYVANTTSSRSAYTVSLFMCDRQFPINQVGLACQSVMNGMYGSFGVTEYSSSLAAKSTYERFVYDDCYDVKRDYAPSKVLIENRLSGELWNDHNGAPVLRWRFHGWRFSACSATGAESIEEARSLMALVRVSPLPSLSGYMVTSRGADNQNTRAAWLDDRSIVTTWALIPQWGVPLTSEMRKWR